MRLFAAAMRSRNRRVLSGPVELLPAGRRGLRRAAGIGARHLLDLAGRWLLDDGVVGVGGFLGGHGRIEGIPAGIG